MTVFVRGKMRNQQSKGFFLPFTSSSSSGETTFLGDPAFRAEKTQSERIYSNFGSYSIKHIRINLIKAEQRRNKKSSEREIYCTPNGRNEIIEPKPDARRAHMVLGTNSAELANSIAIRLNVNERIRIS
jgi:hypothetical protein